MTGHHHSHGPGCCSSGHSKQDERVLEDQLDAAGKSLTRALRVSFSILKGIIVVLLVVFVCSGLTKIQPGEQALKLFFGEIDGPTADPVLKPGFKWALPEPIHQIIRIPVEREQTLNIDSFWYYETDHDKLSEVKGQVSGPLDPLQDGYCLTRNDSLEGMAGTDYNIVHSKWSLKYKIKSPVLFFQNIYTREQNPGEDFLEAAAQTVEPLLESLASSAIVGTMVGYTIDEAIKSDVTISDRVKASLQKKLDQIESGIGVEKVNAVTIVWPRQVDRAFLDSTNAGQEADQLRNEALSYKETLLTDTGGANAEAILAQLKQPGLSQDEQEALVEKLSGQVKTKISEAFAYRTKVVKDAEANAEYLERLLPQYREYPELVLQKLYKDAMEEVLLKADEKVMIQSPGDEYRFQFNRDPNINKGKSKDKAN